MPWWAPGCPYMGGEKVEMSPSVKQAHDSLKAGVFGAAPPAQAEAAAKTKPKCPMCVCKELRGERDMCMLNTGDEEKCKQHVDELNACLLSFGFDMSKGSK